MTVDECTRCSELVESRSQIVNGVGSTDADLVFVGEAPGEQEDEQGEPFVGPSGERLNDALDGTHLTREEVFITNTVRCRPEGNRDPTQDEKTNCFEFLLSEIRTVDPELIVALGGHAVRQLTGEDPSVVNDAGDVYNPVDIGEVMVCMHPAATFYNNEWDRIFTATIEDAARRVQS